VPVHARRVVEARKFATYAEELTHTPFLSTKGKLAFSLHGDHNGVRFEPKEMPTLITSGYSCTRCAPSVLKKEDTHFGKVRKMLRRRLDHSVLQAYLDRQKEILRVGDARRFV
jgi:hypothetical protein